MKLITIIGAGPGISMGVARKFGQEGFRIAFIARTENKLKALVTELSNEGIHAMYALADVADETQMKRALSEIREKEGHAEMILYNAAAVSVKDILEQDWETIKSNLDISVGGYFNLMKMVLPYCLANNFGKLFVTGGGFALQGDPQWTSLSIGKAALRNLVQAFQKRVEGTQIHVAQVTVCGYVNPKDEKYNPDAIAEQFWKLFNQRPEEFEKEIIY
jgi:NADP-dependent 3-hydroxy acid dehydrogenase YdfG